MPCSNRQMYTELMSSMLCSIRARSSLPHTRARPFDPGPSERACTRHTRAGSTLPHARLRVQVIELNS